MGCYSVISLLGMGLKWKIRFMTLLFMTYFSLAEIAASISMMPCAPWASVGWRGQKKLLNWLASNLVFLSSELRRCINLNKPTGKPDNHNGAFKGIPIIALGASMSNPQTTPGLNCCKNMVVHGPFAQHAITWNWFLVSKLGQYMMNLCSSFGLCLSLVCLLSWL